MAAGTISSQILEYATQSQFALPPADPSQNEETWVTAKSQVSEMRDALECTERPVGASPELHLGTAVVPVPAKIDDGVSMKSLEEALDADGGLSADYVSETDSDMEDVSVSGLDATDETISPT
ncbi:hypothetical protein FB45DRAFT_861932 [Roridomyces roridus]|uniref:Uncharacterized protein n=1 Tax=Roridomyces roridus TaxID=1738132 RepID=A0AAD7FYW2_9AGAR|nr:hypothetical protein FB45DRAFT_861932 [Roridomyces roridus]